MPRIAPLPKSRFGPTARITDRVIRKMTGGSFEGTGIAARSPQLLRAGGAMERYFLGRRAVDHRLLELVSLRTAMEVGCGFCIDLGSYMASSKHGVSAEELRGLSDHAECGLFSEGEVAALDLAVAMAATPPTVTDALWERLSEHFSETQLVELTAMAGWENSRARINAAFGVESHGFSPAGTCAIATAHAPATPAVPA